MGAAKKGAAKKSAAKKGFLMPKGFIILLSYK
jgi:hypothetical protein